MQLDSMFSKDGQCGSVAISSPTIEQCNFQGNYAIICHGPDGKEKWRDIVKNTVTTVGKNDCLDKYFYGSAYTAAWYIGLISLTGYTSVPVVGDTMASHATWTEDQNYSQASRVTAVWSTAASAGSKSLASASQFTINATTTIKGSFMTSVNTKGGTTGILFSAGLFSGGDKAVGSGDTLSVSYTASL